MAAPVSNTNYGPSLDWSAVKFHEPVEDWQRLSPDWRLVEQIRVQLTGNVPEDAD